MRTLFLLHGYGVRGFIFEPIKTMFESRFTQVFMPDLNMTNFETLIDSSKVLISNYKQDYPDSKIYLIGHSLGSIVAYFIAKDLGSDVIKGIALLCSPFGKQPVSNKSLIRFLIIHQLIPGFISRPRFFTKQTPKKVQLMLWKKVVPESEAMVDELLSEEPFDTGKIERLDLPSIVIASEKDKVAPYNQTKKLADVLNATEFFIFPKNRNIGHNDVLTSPIVAQEIAEKISTFFLGEKNIWD